MQAGFFLHSQKFVEESEVGDGWGVGGWGVRGEGWGVRDGGTYWRVRVFIILALVGGHYLREGAYLSVGGY